MIITFLSDFGLEDEWVGVCKGVIKRIAPKIEILDLTHSIPKFNLKKGALVLKSALSFMPRGIHLAVVDPGVGTKRKSLVVATKRSDFLVGPDNGLLLPAVQTLGGIKKAIHITNENYFLSPVSATFQARDIFAPVAAYLAKGVPLEEFGPEISFKDLVPSPWEKPKVLKGKSVPSAKDRWRTGLEGEVIDIDRFGTIRFNIESSHLKKARIFLGQSLSLKGPATLKKTYPFRKTFGEASKGTPLLLVDSSNHLCLAINQGDAAEKFKLKVGDKITLQKGEPEEAFGL